MSYCGNPGLLFYKEYFFKPYYKKENEKEKLFFDNIEENNKKFTEHFKLNETTCYQFYSGNKNFHLTTIYPGLLCGSGYAHNLDGDKGFKIGFFFDYTSGLPIIPGSSIKGVLRSVFPGKQGKKLRNEKASYIWEKLFSEEKDDNGNVVRKPILNKKDTPQVEELVEEIYLLEKEIFEGFGIEEKNGKKVLGKEKPIYQRDIFFDAFIVEPGKNDNIFGDDTLCPHGENPLKNPKPLSFLKVLPEVTFQFNFDLKNSTVISGLTAEKKLELFKSILLDIGAGAKTNVGYGQFKEKMVLGLSENIPEAWVELLKADSIFDAKVFGLDNENYYFLLCHQSKGDCVIKKNINKTNKKLNISSNLNKGDKLSIKINENYENGKTLNFQVLKP